MTFYDAGFTTKSLILTSLIMQVSTKLIFGYLWKRKTHILIMKSWRMQFMKKGAYLASAGTSSNIEG